MSEQTAVLFVKADIFKTYGAYDQNVWMCIIHVKYITQTDHVTPQSPLNYN